MIDFDAMQNALSNDTRLLYFCNPQNPTGRVYRKDELVSILEFCISNDITLCTDEVHSQFVLDESCQHINIAALAPDTFTKTISMFSPGKTYNISGCSCSAAVIPDKELRERFRNQRSEFASLGRLNIEATKAAFGDTSSYVPELQEYLRGNRKLVLETLSKIDGLDLAEHEGTYIAFFDLKNFEIEDISSHFQNHGLGLLDCGSYGAPTSSRLNFATPRFLLQEGLNRFRSAIDNLSLRG